MTDTGGNRLLSRGNGRINHPRSVIGRGEGNTRIARDELATEVEVVVADLLSVSMAVPAHVEGDVRRYGRQGRRVGDGVEEVVQVWHGKVVHAEACLAAPRGDIDRGRGNRDRPEQTRSCDAGLEVVYLLSAHGAHEEVNSDEAERAAAPSTVRSDVLALHEAHVNIEGVAGTVTPGRPALYLRRADYAVEVRDR